MGKVNIYTVDFGFNQCYIIRSQGVIMVDGGLPNRRGDFLEALQRLPIEPQDIQLVVITHGHFDHMGSARDIREVTGARIAMHRLDKDCLEKPLNRFPRGVGVWGGLLRGVLPILKPFIHAPPCEVDIVLDDDGMSLTDFGIPGRVVHTPGHTTGSVSVVLDSGDAFVGCMAQNKFPLRLNPELPVLADDLDLVKKSWKHLLELGMQTIYPGHGKPFPAAVIRDSLET